MTAIGEVALTTGEVQTIVAARRLRESRSVFIGVGRPSTAAILARMVHNPELVLVYESGTIGATPFHVPLSIGDGELADTADAVVSVPEMFNYWIKELGEVLLRTAIYAAAANAAFAIAQPVLAGDASELG